MIRLQIVAHVRLYREGLKQTLSDRSQVLIVGTSSDSSHALDEIIGLEPDVVLLDIATPGAAVLVQKVRQLAPGPRVVGLAVRETENDILSCVEAGISGYVPAEGSLEDLLAAIESVARGEMLCPPRIVAALARRVTDLAARQPPPVPPLTYREREVIDLIDRGCSNKQIAQQLHITISTVKNHIHHVLKKLGVRKRREITALYSVSFRSAMIALLSAPQLL